MFGVIINMYGNFFSIYYVGWEVRKVLDEVCYIIVDSIYVIEKEIIFISGGIEGDNLVIIGVVLV